MTLTEISLMMQAALSGLKTNVGLMVSIVRNANGLPSIID
jgi:hypothetical protein